MRAESRQIVVVGPASYVGRRLVARLLDRPDVRVRVVVTEPRRISDLLERVAEVIVGDPVEVEVLRRALAGAEIAYFPIGLLGSDGDLAQRLPAFAQRFRDACIEAGVQRMVYYGPPPDLAVRSRASLPVVDVGSVLAARPERIQTIWLRAGFVLGRGSALFDVIGHLVRKFRLLLVPRWMNNPIDWIGLEDALHDLMVAIDVSVQGDLVAHIGPPPASVRQMVDATARTLGLRRRTVAVPISLPRLSTWLVLLTTPLSHGLSGPFVSLLSLPSNANQPPPSTGHWLAVRGKPYASLEAAIADAVRPGEQEDESSHWTASLMGVSFEEEAGDPNLATFRDIRRVDFGALPASRVFRAVQSIGGRGGWFRFNLLWQVRGLLDKLVGGFGTSIGRRTEGELRVGDLLDVWRVVDLQPNRRLLLMAHMKTFGKAWLEFKIEGQTLVQTAYHLPEGMMGRLYWYAMLPFHVFIFPDMIDSIIRRARQMGDDAKAPPA